MDLTIFVTKKVPEKWVPWLNYQMCKINKDLLENQITFEFVFLRNQELNLSVSLPVFYNKHPSGKYIAEMSHRDWYPFYIFSHALSIIKTEKVSFCKVNEVIEYDTTTNKYRMNTHKTETIIRKAIITDKSFHFIFLVFVEDLSRNIFYFLIRAAF